MLSGRKQLSQHILEELACRGWATISWDPAHSLFDLSRLLFRGTCLGVDTQNGRRTILRALPTESGRPGSKSAIRGLEEFSLHTDGASDFVPPHYLLLRSLSGASRSTTDLLPLSKVRIGSRTRSDLSAGLWIAGGTRRAHICAVFEQERYRWDEDCMRPMDRMARRAHDEFRTLLEKAPQTSHEWSNCSTVLIIDNWQTLHGRSPVCRTELRELERLYVDLE